MSGVLAPNWSDPSAPSPPPASSEVESPVNGEPKEYSPRKQLTPSPSRSSTRERGREEGPPLLAFPSRTSMSSLSNASPPPTSEYVLMTAAELQASIQMVTRYAFLDMATTVLRLDFWRESDSSSIVFCKLTFDIVAACMGMPEKTTTSLKQHLETGDCNEDIATLIMSIRKDDKLSSSGATISLVGAFLLAIVSTGNYDSRHRVLLRHMCTLLGVVWDDFEEIEDTLALQLLQEQFTESEDPEPTGQSKEAREKSQRSKKIKRYLMIGAAGGVGGVLIGLTGGLAAPLVAAGAGVVIGGAAAAGIATTAGAAVLGSAFGIAGAGLAGYKMKKRVGAIEEFAVGTLSDGGTSLRTVLTVSGWIDKDTKPEEAFVHQWRHLCCAKEQYTLHYESRYLRELGNAIDYLMSFAVSVAIQQTLMETALHGLLAAVAWPVALMSCASVMDNPWNVCISRATEVGEHLAEVLLSRAHGKRPITLIGFSLGARVIFHCLLAMSKRSDSVGIIEDVILLGAPVSASPKQWSQICRVVGGRVINGYCETDWLLRFVYRTMSVQFSIAGTSPVDNRSNPSIFNHNLSHIVKGHLDYSRKLTEVLAAVQLRVSPHSEESVDNLVTVAEEVHEDEAAEQSSEEITKTDEKKDGGMEAPVQINNGIPAEDDSGDGSQGGSLERKRPQFQVGDQSPGSSHNTNPDDVHLLSNLNLK